MPCLQEITFAEHAESEVIPASDSVEVGYAGEDSGGHCGSGGNHVDCEEDAEVATALWCEQPRVVQAKGGGQHSDQESVSLPCSSFHLLRAQFQIQSLGACSDNELTDLFIIIGNRWRNPGAGQSFSLLCVFYLHALALKVGRQGRQIQNCFYSIFGKSKFLQWSAVTVTAVTVTVGYSDSF